MLSAVVVSNKMDKTVVVRVSRLQFHSRYKRLIRRHKKFKVHDEKNEAKIGDNVMIMETRPLSKEKRWRLVEIIK
jgi:small subunit ribosomal protein S17